MNVAKPAGKLSISDFQRYPIWRYTNVDELSGDETIVAPIEVAPVVNLDSCVIGVPVTLNNGRKLWAMLCNIDLENDLATRQFLQLSLSLNDRWFHVARYFDIDFENRSPSRLADALGLPLNQIFPIVYDLTHLVSGSSEVLHSKVLAEPDVRLSREERMKLALR